MGIEFCRALWKQGVFCMTFRKGVVRYIPMLNSTSRDLTDLISATGYALDEINKVNG
jgi:adenosylmethionine-8-amino-7-oxononanoate aminotransferase